MGCGVIKEFNGFLRFCRSHRDCYSQSKGMQYTASYEIGPAEPLPPAYILHILNTCRVMSDYATVPSALRVNHSTVFPAWQDYHFKNTVFIYLFIYFTQSSVSFTEIA